MGECQLRLCHQRRWIADERAAMPITGCNEARRGVLAKQRDIGGVNAVTHGEHATGVAAVGCVAKCRCGAEGDVWQVEGVSRREARHGAGKFRGGVKCKRAGAAGFQGHVGGRRPEELEIVAAGDGVIPAAWPGRASRFGIDLQSEIRARPCQVRSIASEIGDRLAFDYTVASSQVTPDLVVSGIELASPSA
jgi:hypothetical protein